ncbi:flagellar export protein FliJ [Pantoea agglomerans]|uniref:Flagellar export protein FliJ n=1 Tax=Enterobacter agglomerans TaxID=549 RepID=A0ACC5RIZ0_ENTAG|nr:flagellar export protein FliJ [Pantoea agglomerans]MBK4724660.1 flagellar export protein FliJ [Pantoea agglomerans]
MSREPESLRILKMLYQMRQRDVEKTTGKLMQQKQVCQRYSNNIEALSALSDSSSGMAAGAAQMNNQARFKATIQRVIGWQEQEKALAVIEHMAIQRELIEQARREMAINTVMEQQRVALRQVLDRDQQKITDAQAIQSWMRKQGITR